MECHACPYAADVAAGVYADEEWEKTPCASCMGSGGRPPPGKFHVELVEEKTKAPVGASPEDILMPVSVLADALTLLLALPRNVLEVLRLRYQGVKYREIAARLGMGRSTCSMMVVRALGGHPALAELIPRTKSRVVARAARRKRT